MENIDLNAPAFGPGSQLIEDEAEKEETINSEEEIVVEETPEVTPEEEEVPAEPLEEEESKVPYSRFKKFHDEATDLRQKVADYEARFENREPMSPQESDVPTFWTDLYGESDAATKAWRVQEKQNQSLIEDAREQAIEAVRNERTEEANAINSNMESLDNQIESLSDFVGRKLTGKEESSILDIVDEYTPKDENGNYAGQTIPMDKAWEIYELKNSASKAPKKASRDSVASLSAKQTDGQPNSKNEQDTNFDPLNWNAYKNRI